MEGREEGETDRERDFDLRETHQLDASCTHPDWGQGLNLQLRSVPLTGNEDPLTTSLYRAGASNVFFLTRYIQHAANREMIDGVSLTLILSH